MEIFLGILYFLVFGLFSLVQFGLTIIGLITVIRWIIDYSKKRNSNKMAVNKKQSEPAQPAIVQVDNKEGTKVKNTKPQSIALESSAKNTQLNSANFLLYLGSFLFLGGVLVLVSFDWPLINGAIKTIILIFTMIAFLGGGSYLITQTSKFNSVGKVLLVVGNLIVALSGLGFWNFGISEIWSGRYATYNLGYSIIILIVTFISLKIINNKAYQNIFMLAVYNFFLGIATGLTADFNYQVVLFAAINLVFRLTSEFTFTSISKQAKKISVDYSTLINFCVDIAIMSLVSYNLLLGVDYSGTEKVIILFALVIPLFHHLVGRRAAEIGVLHITMPFKVLIVGVLFSLSYLSYVSLFLLLPIIYHVFSVGITKYREEQDKNALNIFSFSLSTLILIIVSYATTTLLIFSD